MLARAGTVAGRASLELTVDTDEVVQRLLKRAEIEGRADDTEDVIRHRLERLRRGDRAARGRLPRAWLLRQVDGMGDDRRGHRAPPGRALRTRQG